MAKSRDEWITSAEAAKIMSENSGHPVPESYVRQLAIDGKIRKKAVDGRTNLYLKRDAAGYVVRKFTRRNVAKKNPLWVNEAIA